MVIKEQGQKPAEQLPLEKSLCRQGGLKENMLVPPYYTFPPPELLGEAEPPLLGVTAPWTKRQVPKYGTSKGHSLRAGFHR